MTIANIPDSLLDNAHPSMALPAPENVAKPWQLERRREYGEMIGAAKIAMIDDEELNIDVIQVYLKREGYRNFHRTSDARNALELIKTVMPDVVLLDVKMPHVSGLEILQQMRSHQLMGQIPVIVLTACAGPEIKLQALKLGSSDFLAKPVDASELLLRLKNVIAVKDYQDHLAVYSQELEEQVRLRTRELVESRQRIIHCLARAAEFRDDDTGLHVMRVGKYVGVLARTLGLDPDRAEILEQAAQLHDIGKIGVPDSVLLKEGKLDAAEFDSVKLHCEFGESIINPLSFKESQAWLAPAQSTESLDLAGYPVMEVAAIIAGTHHEKWDGSGYPRGLSGAEIPIEGRITAVADVYDALSSRRPYKPAFPQKKCFKILREGRGKHFDPRVLDAFFESCSEILAIQQRYAENPG